MLDCLILGDSIAKGVSDIRKECVAYVKSGINSKDYWYKNKTFLTKQDTLSVKTTIISLGSNDTDRIRTIEFANNIRERIKGRVYWILPSAELKPIQHEVIKGVAKIWGDLTIQPESGKLNSDKIHPTYAGYKHIAEQTK